MSYGEDVYSSPEKHGLTMIGEVDFSSGSYEFDLTAVWQVQSSGQFLYGDDSGCSCPSPFEGYRNAGELTPCTRDELHAHLNKRNGEGYSGDRSGDIAELMTRVVAADRSAR
jgi:hypothetical protein